MLNCHSAYSYQPRRYIELKHGDKNTIPYGAIKGRIIVDKMMVRIEMPDHIIAFVNSMAIKTNSTFIHFFSLRLALIYNFFITQQKKYDHTQPKKTNEF